MKRITLFLLLCTLRIYTTVVVPILDTNQDPAQLVTSFPFPISAKVFDRPTGIFFVGLSGQAAHLTLSAANRSSFGSSIFHGISKNFMLNDADGIDYLTLATHEGNTNPILGIVAKLAAGPQQAKVVVSSNQNGTSVGVSPILNDASGTPNMNGLPTSGIVGLAASQFYMFPALKPCGGNFGADCNGGIASVAINQTTLALAQVPAGQGDAGIKAKKLDPTTPELLINNSPTVVPNTLEMVWDNQLQRLYIGLQMITAGNSASGPTCATGTGICTTGVPHCSAGLMLDTVTFECVTCPSGGIFNPQSKICQLCPTGKLFDIASLACQTVTCPAGSFFNPNPAVLACVTCSPGLFFNPTTLACVTCPAGGIFINPIGCTSCQSGTIFSATAGGCVATSAAGCPSGNLETPAGICVVPLPCQPGFVFDVVSLTCQESIPDEEIIPQPLLLHRTNTSSTPNYGGQIGNGETLSALPRDVMLSRAVVASGGKSVIVARVDEDGALTFENIAPNGAFALGGTENIVGVYDAIPQPLAIHKLRVMHTSTGPSYLIVNGSVGTINDIGGELYALPLVDRDDPNDSAQGTLAKKDAPLVDYRFVTPAQTNADLPTITEAAVVIGGGPVPLPVGGLISDIDVVGDTVYVSINNAPSAVSEGGILYSQALFNQEGKINDWTPWTKKAFPPFPTNGQPPASAVSYFSVDALTAKVWAVDNAGTSVAQTAWNNTASTAFLPNSSLVAQLNAQIKGPSLAVLDLDQSARGFLSNQSRYALFAGDNKIIFARISQALGANVNSPQTVITDFSLPSNFLVTTIPATSTVTVLEYARQLTGTPTNYFFAGASNGLLVFSNGGNGFDVATMGALNAPPFSNGSWSFAPNINGWVVDVKTTGNVLYVLVAQPATATTAMQSTLYRIPFQPTVAAMFAPGNIFTLARTGIGIFNATFLFNAIELLSTNSTGSTEQLVVATNNGLYRSSRAGGVQAAANQGAAAWQLIPNSNFYYNDIAAVDNASIPFSSPSTLWPLYIADQDNQGTFSVSVLQQLNGTTDAGPFSFVPSLFNSIDAATNPAFTTLPQITAFWSDGARRIAVISNIESSCIPMELLSLPFNTLEWNITTPFNAILSDPILNSLFTFYWIKQIGVSGILMVGTENGIVALE